MHNRFSEKDYEKLLKIARIAENAATIGEKKAALHAANRIAQRYRLRLDETFWSSKAEQDSFKTTGASSRTNANQHQKKRSSSTHQKAKTFYQKEFLRRRFNHHSIKTERIERLEKQRYEQALHVAFGRGLSKGNLKQKPKVALGRYHKQYKATKEDQERLVLALLKDGVPLERVALTAGCSTVDVAQIWLLSRQIGISVSNTPV